MSGILDKKTSLIDYKLTENGRKQIQNGDINYVYYSLSDKSVVYNSELNLKTDREISNTDLFYLPFEVETDPNNYVNPEYNLSEELDYNFIQNDISNDNTINKFIDLNTKFTLSNQLSGQKLLGNIDVLRENNNISFSLKEVKSEYDFKSSNIFLNNYPTIDTLYKKTSEIKKINEDPRFTHKLNNQLLPPVNIDGTNILSETTPDINQGIKYFFKNLSRCSIEDDDSREEIANKVINSLEEYNIEDLFSLKYVLNNKDKDTTIIPELHEINTDENGNEIKTKLAFLNLGSFLNKKTNRVNEIYLIGRIILDRKSLHDYNEDSNLLTKNILVNYSFVNLFTLVVE